MVLQKMPVQLVIGAEIHDHTALIGSPQAPALDVGSTSTSPATGNKGIRLCARIQDPKMEQMCECDVDEEAYEVSTREWREDMHSDLRPERVPVMHPFTITLWCIQSLVRLRGKPCVC